MLQTRNAKRTSAAENSELMEKHLLPRVMYSRNLFFSPLQNTCDLFILFHMGQFLGKSCGGGDGLCSTRKCCQSQGLKSPAHWSAAVQPDPGDSPGCTRPSLLPLYSPSTACVCTACTWTLQRSSFSKLLADLNPCKLLGLILKVLIRCVRPWYCQNSWIRYCPVMQHWLLNQF